MKFAVIADIHGNLPALESVLSDAHAHGAEHYLFLGDYCVSNPYPAECIDRMMALDNKTVISGNEEQHMLHAAAGDRSSWTDGQMQAFYYSCRSLNQRQYAFLKALPEQVTLTFPGLPKLHLAHSAKAFLQEGYPNVFRSSVIAKQYANRFVRMEEYQHDAETALNANRPFLDKVCALEEGVYLFGHFHGQLYYRLENSRTLLLNPGACGLPLDCIRDGVPYSLLTLDSEAPPQVEQLRAPFDTQGYIQTLLQSEHARAARVWTELIAEVLQARREVVYFFLRYMEQYAQSIGDANRPYSVSTWEQGFDSWNASREKIVL